MWVKCISMFVNLAIDKRIYIVPRKKLNKTRLADSDIKHYNVKAVCGSKRKTDIQI